MRAPGRGEILHAVGLGAVLLLALGLRLHRLGRLSLWTDEGHTVWAAAQPLGDYPRLAARDTCLPLSYLVTKPFIVFSGTDEAARLPAVCFGVASIAVTWALGRAIGGAGLGLLAALLVTVHPLHLHYSQEARMYAMSVCFVGLAGLLLLRFVSRPGWKGGALLAGAVAAAGCTHDVASLWVAALVVTLLPVGLLTGRRGRWPTRKVLGGLVVVGLAVAAMLLPWVPILRQHLAHVAGPDWWMPRPTADHLRRVWERFALPWSPGDVWGCEVFASAGFGRFLSVARRVWVGLLAAGFLAAVVGRRWRLVGVGAWGGVAVVSIIVVSRCWQPLVGERVWLPMVVPVALVQAGALVVPQRWGWIRRRRLLRVGHLAAAGAALGVVLVLSGFGLWSEYVCQGKEGWRRAVSVVVTNYRQGDVIFTREGDPRSDVTWCLEQKVVAWYLQQHGLTGALRRPPAAYFGSLDFETGRFDAPAIRPVQPGRQVQRVSRHLAGLRRIWYIRRTWGEPVTRPPALDWLDRHAAWSRSWTRDVCTVTLHWGLKRPVQEGG